MRHHLNTCGRAREPANEFYMALQGGKYTKSKTIIIGHLVAIKTGKIFF